MYEKITYGGNENMGGRKNIIYNNGKCIFLMKIRKVVKMSYYKDDYDSF